MKKKISIIGTVGLPANYGGFETLAEHIVNNMNQQYDISVYCSGKQYPKSERKQSYKNAKLFYLPLNANGIQSILYDTLSILHALFRSDVLLILGVAGAWILPFVRLFTNKKIIISIDGIEWKRDKWNMLAKWYLFWAESIAVKYSHIDISDNEAIQDYTALRYGTLSRIIEYGADHVLTVEPEVEDIQKYPFLDMAYAFKVCRIEPENNVHIVLEAFSKALVMPLVMVGNWAKSEYGMQLKATYKNHPNIHLYDPIYDQKALDTLRSNASLYVHGHSAGGTNPSLVEAMYLGLPIFTFGVSYNRVTTEEKASYFATAEDLQALLKKFSAEELIENGIRMKSIADRRYTWKLIASKYSDLVKEALEAKSKKGIESKTATVPYDELLNLGIGHLHNQESFYTKR